MRPYLASIARLFINVHRRHFSSAKQLQEDMKSEKIPFRVADASGWEEGYPARDLELHSPWVKGWRAPR